MLKTTQKWDDLGQVGIDNAMFDPTYVVQNTEIENKKDKVGYGILFHMIKLESDSEKDWEIHIVSPALRFTWPDFSGHGLSGNLASLQGGSEV